MGDLKPLGSEKLNGDDKLKRILELTYYNSTPKKSTTTSNKAETIKESVNKTVYGIVKEKDGYYVKRGLNENSLDYIGGMFMKNKNRFSSYAEALKRMDLLVGQERLNEATKYVLKQKSEGGSDTPPPPPPGEDMGAVPPPPPGEDMGAVPPPPPGEDMGAVPPPPPGEDAGEVPPPPSGEDAGGEGGGSDQKRSDYMADIQKFAGKLGQELRDQREKLESDDLKYVLNMIISAVDLERLEDDDIEEIGKKFEREEGSEEGGEETPMEPESTEETPPPSEDESTSADEELGETMDKLESFIQSEFDDSYDETPKMGELDGEYNLSGLDEINLDQFNDLSEEGHEEDVKELDLDEIKDQISKSIGETLSKYFK